MVHPFVIKAVASVPAPKGYQAPNGRGTVFVYQPIDGIDPGDWSGKQMTGASGFTDSNHPMASGLVVDPALVDFSSVFPLRWQGLLQVRMFYTAPDAALFNTPYPVANLRISGTTWTQVGGGPVNCAGGQARSNELALPQKKVAPGYVTAPPSAQPAADQGSAPGSGSGRITGAASTRSATASAASAQTVPRSSSGGAGPGDSSPVSADSTASSKPSSALPIVVLIIVVGLAVAATGGFVLYRRAAGPPVDLGSSPLEPSRRPIHASLTARASAGRPHTRA